MISTIQGAITDSPTTLVILPSATDVPFPSMPTTINNSGPAIPAPPGGASDLSRANPIYPWDIVLQCIVLPLTTILLVVRAYVQLHIVHNIKTEDILCMLAYLLFVPFCVLAIICGATWGGGKHAWDVDGTAYAAFASLMTDIQILYCPLIMLSKDSILLLYCNVFRPRRSDWAFWTIWGLISFVSLFYIAIMFVAIFGCADTHCVDPESVLVATGIVNLLTDISILLLPVVLVARLKLNQRTKLGLLAVFLVGTIAPITSGFRMFTSMDYNNADITYWSYRIILWTEAEAAISIICSCMPFIPAFFRHFIPEAASAVTEREGSSAVRTPVHDRVATRGIELYHKSNGSHVVESLGNASPESQMTPALKREPWSAGL